MIPQFRRRRSPIAFHPPIIGLDQLNMSSTTKEILRKNWPYEWLDFGGGVRDIPVHLLHDLSVSDLEKVKGIGPKRAKEIKRAVAEIWPY